jgi:hypothetical protein
VFNEHVTIVAPQEISAGPTWIPQALTHSNVFFGTGDMQAGLTADRSSQVGDVLLEFTAVSVAGGVGAAFSGASLLGISIATVGANALVASYPDDPGLAALLQKPTKLNGTITEPNLPPKTIVNEDGVTITHNTRGGDHGPPHAHVSGEGPDTRIGQAGKPLRGDPELSAAQRNVIQANKGAIRKAIGQIGRYFRFARR